MRFKRGDRVRIQEDSWCYGCSTRNPANTEGVVVEVRSYTAMDHPVIVEWPGVGTNYYQPSDIEVIEQLLLEI